MREISLRNRNNVFKERIAFKAKMDEERKAKFRSSIPLGRFSTALDVANAAMYLASDEADFISGVCIEVDGARCV